MYEKRKRGTYPMVIAKVLNKKEQGHASKKKNGNHQMWKCTFLAPDIRHLPEMMRGMGIENKI